MGPPVSAVTVRVPAKVNLVLAVGPLRADGYHEVATLYQAVSLHDEVEARAEPGLSVSIEGDRADEVPLDTENLAVQAAQSLAAYAGVPADVHLTVRKEIPVAGGLAGGSADAAAALVACDALWDTGLGRGELATLAARLGSDVPFALAGGTALGTGRGERLTPVMVGGSFHWVIAVASGGLSTPRVYAELDRLRTRRPVPAHPQVPLEVMAALRAGDAAALGAALSNDLQEAAFSLDPSLRATLEAGVNLGAVAGLVSGSGPTCVFLARDDDHADDLSAGLSASGVSADIVRATGPVPGARVT